MHRAEAALDGLCVIRTSVAKDDMSSEQAVLNYKRLAEVERAFRTLKGVDLNVRPIRHRLDGRAARSLTPTYRPPLPYPTPAGFLNGTAGPASCK